jgi:hypothetical protein
MRFAAFTLAGTLTLVALTGCQPPLILNNTGADTGGTNQPPHQKPANDGRPKPGPIRCIQAPCP